LPDEEFINIYAQLSRLQKERRSKYLKEDIKFKSLNEKFFEKSKSLQRPKVTKRDLVGWLNTIYKLLPEGEFTTQQIYKFESELARIYPDNKNIRPKIRQQLQVLRDLGVLKHLGPSHWIKSEYL
jgi:type II restriction enzyme